MRLRPLALVATLSAMVCSAAFAQAASPPSVSTQRDLGFGAQVLVMYDNNSARSGGALAKQRGLSPEDVTVTPTLDFNLTQPVGQQTLYVNGSAGYQFHRRNKVLDRQNVTIDGGATTQFGFCQATAFASYRASQADLQDLDPLTTKNLRDAKGLGASLQCGRPSGLGANLMVQKTENHNSESRLRVSDSDTDIISFGVGYSNQTLGTIGVNYSYASNAFPNRIIIGRPIGDGYFSESFGLTAQRNFGPRLSVNLAASRIKLKREFAPPGFPLRLTGTTYGGNLSYSVGSRISLSAGASRSIQPSGRPGKLYDVAETKDVGIGYKLGSSFDLSLNHTIGKVTSNRDSLTPILVITDSHLNSTTAGVSFSSSGRFSLGLNVRYDDRQTNLPQFDYTATTVSLRAGTTF
jgi:Putative beta-barrel porin 2